MGRGLTIYIVIQVGGMNTCIVIHIGGKGRGMGLKIFGPFQYMSIKIKQYLALIARHRKKCREQDLHTEVVLARKYKHVKLQASIILIQYSI